MKKFLLGLLLGLACAAPAHEHHDAPHGGSLIELGDEFANVELVLDSDAGKLSAYIFDGEVEGPLRLAQKSLRLSLMTQQGKALDLELKAVANPLTGEKIGDSSEFSVFSKGLRGLQGFKGKLEKLSVHGEVFKKIACQFPAEN